VGLYANRSIQLAGPSWQPRLEIAYGILKIETATSAAGAVTQRIILVLTLQRSKASKTRQIFEWLVLNLLAGNNDAHLKNLSFLVRADGDIQLAPHYDLLSTASYESRAYEKTN
jgi:serine/threonine protein kinase HipA of HipAB toxin-antitoxin module